MTLNMRSRLSARLFALLRFLWIYKLTTEGKLACGCALIASGVAMASLDIPAYHLLSGLSGLIFVAFCAGWLFRKPVHIEGRFPGKGIAGQPVTGAFALTNHGKRTAYDLSAGVFGLPPSLTASSPASALDQLDSGATSHVSITIEPKRRGIYPLPGVRAFSTYPLGLFRNTTKNHKRTTATDGDSILVYPHFHPVGEIDVPVSARYQPGGIALSSNVGESAEYIGNREYRPGDPTRQIDHRSWARLGSPVIKEYQEEYYCRIALVLDTFVPGSEPPPPRGFENMEAAVSLSASVADVLARGEYIIDLFAAGPELYVFRAGRHTALFENVLEILACVDVCRKSPFETITPALAEELGNISTVICVLLDWDADHERLVRAAAEQGCSVKVLIVRDGPTTLPYTHHDWAGAISQYAPSDIAKGGIEVL
ncbi:MAG: DUF58 domain-containing protein [Nitrospiraceae bacterium]|nr:DUF58 domain-containing protein [Nitrospiraceae bacterium]